MTVRKKVRIGITILVIGLVLVLSIKFVPWFLSFSDPQVRDDFKAFVDSLGIRGVFLMLGLQVLQIIVAILPGESIEVLAGLTYGTWGGFAICMLGIFIGTYAVFSLVKVFGKGLVEKIFSSEKVKKLSFLHNERKLEFVIFLLFFIPGTPKDLLTYFAPLTKISLINFLIITMFARIPSVLTSTYAGKAITEGEWWQTAIVFIIMGSLSVLGIVISNWIVKRKNSQ